MDLLEAKRLPEIFARWFASRGWTPRAHQVELLAKAQAGRSRTAGLGFRQKFDLVRAWRPAAAGKPAREYFRKPLGLEQIHAHKLIGAVRERHWPSAMLRSFAAATMTSPATGTDFSVRISACSRLSRFNHAAAITSRK